MHNCAPCHFPNVDDQMDPSLIMVLVGLQCMLCGQALRAATMLICDKCFPSWHMGCHMPPIEEMLVGKWFAIDAPNKPRFPRSHNRSLMIFFTFFQLSELNHSLLIC